MVCIEPTFAVDAVEGTYLSIARLKIDAQRHSHAATFDRAENRRRIDDGCHWPMLKILNFCKFTNLGVIWQHRNAEKQKELLIVIKPLWESTFFCYFAANLDK